MNFFLRPCVKLYNQINSYTIQSFKLVYINPTTLAKRHPYISLSHSFLFPRRLASLSLKMGNLVSSSKSWVSTGGKLIFSDGTIDKLTEPTTVAEIMLNHPNNYVIDSHLVPSKGTKLNPLPADHILEINKVYLLLPMTRGKLSAEEARRILASSQPTKRLKRSCSAPISPVPTETERSLNFTIPSILEDRPEFMSVNRQLSCKGWKPSLGTIVEMGSSKKVPHWLL
jgi:PADRE domain